MFSMPTLKNLASRMLINEMENGGFIENFVAKHLPFYEMRSLATTEQLVSRANCLTRKYFSNESIASRPSFFSKSLRLPFELYDELFLAAVTRRKRKSEIECLWQLYIDSKYSVLNKIEYFVFTNNHDISVSDTLQIKLGYVLETNIKSYNSDAVFNALRLAAVIGVGDFFQTTFKALPTIITDLQDHQWHTLFTLAAQHGHLAVIGILWKIVPVKFKTDILSPTKCRAFGQAVIEGHINIVKYFWSLASAPQKNALVCHNEYDYFLLAVDKGQLATVQFMWEHITNNRLILFSRALASSIKKNHLSIVTFFWENATTEQRNSERCICAALAANFRYIEIFNLFWTSSDYDQQKQIFQFDSYVVMRYVCEAGNLELVEKCWNMFIEDQTALLKNTEMIRNIIVCNQVLILNFFWTHATANKDYFIRVSLGYVFHPDDTIVGLKLPTIKFAWNMADAKYRQELLTLNEAALFRNLCMEGNLEAVTFMWEISDESQKLKFLTAYDHFAFRFAAHYDHKIVVAFLWEKSSYEVQQETLKSLIKYKCPFPHYLNKKSEELESRFRMAR